MAYSLELTQLGLEPSPYETDDKHQIGRDPRKMTVEDLNTIGHIKQPILDVIRAKCLDCSHTQSEVRKCTCVCTCPLWPYRMGSNPFISRRESEPSAAQLAAREAFSARRKALAKKTEA